MNMPVSDPLSLIGKKVLVGVPQRSKFGGSGAEFGGSWECDVAESASSLNIKPFLKNRFFDEYLFSGCVIP
jgi:hypothetical protein